jgi:hypothetical protein
MSHIPINHPLRPVYRVLGGLTGIWLLVFGVLGLYQTGGAGWFVRGDWTAMAVPTNRAFAAISVVAGLVVVAAAFIGHNVDRFVNVWGGVGFLAGGTLLLAVSHTGLNVFNASAITSVASYVIGFVLLASGLYGKVATVPGGATPAPVAAEQTAVREPASV